MVRPSSAVVLRPWERYVRTETYVNNGEIEQQPKFGMQLSMQRDADHILSLFLCMKLLLSFFLIFAFGLADLLAS